jgi:hypothetical protein
MFLTAAPASGGNVIAVGSTMNSHIPGYVIKISSQNDDLDIGEPYTLLILINI